MLARRLSRFLLKTPVIIALGALAAYLLFSWFAFGPLAQWGAVKFIADKTGHRLSLDPPVFDPFRLSVTVRNLRLTDPEGKPLAGCKELFVDFALSSLLRFAWTFDALRLTAPEGRLALLPGDRLNWTAFLDAFKGKEEEKAELAKGLPRLLIRNFVLKEGRVDFSDQTVSPLFETAVTPLDIALEELSTLPDDKGAYQISARTTQGSQWRWKGEIGLRPVSVTGAFSLEGFRLAQLEPYLKGRFAIAAPEGTAGFSTQYRIGYENRKLSLNLDSLAAAIEGLRLRGAGAAEPSLALEKITFAGGSFDLERRSIRIAAIDLAGGKVKLIRRTDGSLDVQQWPLAAAPAGEGKEGKTAGSGAPVPPSPEPAAGRRDSQPTDEAAKAAPWHLDLGRFSLDGIAIHLLDKTFAEPLALAIGNLKIGFKADARFGAGPVHFTLSEGGAALEGIAASSGEKPLFAMDGAALEGVRLSLAERRAEALRLKLERGRLSAVRASDGAIPLLAALKPAAKAAPEQSGTGEVKASADPAWKWRLALADLNGFQVALRDEKVNPAAGVTLEEVGISVAGLSQNLDAAVPVRLGLRVREGGVLKAQGLLVPAKGSLDAQLDLERDLQRRAGRTPDYAEGVRAFMDKRPPRFTGRTS